MTDCSFSFGDPASFCIRGEWSSEDTSTNNRPIHHGWSMGKLELLVANIPLTAHEVNGKWRNEVEWYLGPFIHWLCDNWIPILHEQLFSWPNPPEGPASTSVERSLYHWSRGEDDRAEQNYRAVQSWYARHCASAASAGGLFPQVYLRRFLDEIEISWTAQPAGVCA